MATAAIFFSCAVGHGLHAISAVPGLINGSGGGHSNSGWLLSVSTAATAAIAVYYWTLRRTYGALMQGAALFESLEQQRRLTALESGERIAAARAEAEQERDAHAAMLRAVIANSQSLIYVKDLDGRYLMANEPFERAFGVDADELLGKDDDWLDPKLAHVWRDNDLRAREREYFIEEWSDAPDGRRFYDSVKFPLFDARGALYATCGVSLDVTERRRATEVMAKARDEAVAMTAAKTSFLATMSHEIRTPMNAVIGMTDLLLDTELDSEQQEFVQTVRTSGDALLAVINDILDFSKIDAGALELEHIDFDVRSCAEDTVNLLAHAAADKGLDLVLHVDDSCPSRLLGDATRLRQVLVNLVSNAVKFTHQGDVLLSVNFATNHDGRIDATFAVIDTGIGIPAGRLTRLFQSFSQIDASTTRKYGGTGLGLAISQRLVAAMGGVLEVESVEGRGTTFRFTVPLEPSSTPAQPPVLPLAHLRGQRALVVDDSPTNRRILCRQLEGWGMVPTEAASGEEALALVHAGAVIDVALLDMKMPQMDGSELATELAALPETRDVPVLMLTSLNANSESKPTSDYAAYLTKPIRRGPLHDALRAALAPKLVDAPNGAPAGALHASTATVLAARRLRVLIAEDNPINQRVAELMITKLGHRVQIVSDGQEALDAVQRISFDLVLMDLQMPIMDGIAATRAIRELVVADHQPVIVALTAGVGGAEQQNCSAAGMDGYLSKPVRQAELAELLTALVENNGRAAAAGSTVGAELPVGPAIAPALDCAAFDTLLAQLDDDLTGLGAQLLRRFETDSGPRITRIGRCRAHR